MYRLIAALLLTTTATAGQPADWPQWRGPNRDGTSNETGLSTDWKTSPPRRLWTASVGIGFSSIAVSDSLALATGNEKETDTLYAFDAATGKLRWKHSYRCPLAPLRHEGGPYATPTIEAGRVVMFSKIGRLFCLNLADGKLLWETDIAKQTGTQAPNYGFSGSPLIEGDLVIVNAGPAGAAFSKATGKRVWSSRGESRPGHTSPLARVVGDKRSVVILAESQIAAVEPTTGRVLWKHELPDFGRPYKITDPLLVGDKAFVTSSYQDFCALFQITDGSIEQLWKGHGLVSKFLCPLLVDGHFVGGHYERTLRCIDPADGKVKWEQPFAGTIVRAGDHCLILTTDGELILADVSASSYKALARWRALAGKCWTAPALAGGKVYCRNARGDIVCVQLPTK